MNAAGGKQSKSSTRCDLFPPAALLAVAGVLKRGAHYGKDNWRLIPQADHLNHAMTHLLLHLAGDTSETHLANAACRLLFAMETHDDAPPPVEQAAEPQTLPFPCGRGQRYETREQRKQRLREEMAQAEIGEAGA